MRLVLAVIALSLAAPDLVRADELRPRAHSVVVAHEEQSALPTLGPLHAPVTIEFFITLTSRINLNAYVQLLALAKRHPRRLRVVFRILDNSGVTKLAEAVLEAHAQGRFFDIMGKLSDRRSRRRRRIRARTNEQIQKLADSAGVDFGRILEAWRDERHHQTLQRNELYRRRRRAAHRALTLLINGHPSNLRGSEITVARLEQLYDKAYAKAQRMMQQGAALEHVYPLSVLDHDASLPPVRVNAGALNGESGNRAEILYDAPLARPEALRESHRLGPEKARVTLHFYCDFSRRLRYCRETKGSLDEVLEHYPGVVRVFFHHMVPTSLVDDDLEETLRIHTAAECAAEQDLFPAFFDRIYRGPRLRRRRRIGPAFEQWMESRLETLELDRAAFDSCMEGPEASSRVEFEIRKGRKAGITKSPTVLVGGRTYTGSKSSEELIRLIDIELMPGLLQQLAPDPPGSPDWFDDLTP